MIKTKNEIIKGLHLGKDALDKTQSQQAQIIFTKKKIEEAIRYLDGLSIKKKSGMIAVVFIALLLSGCNYVDVFFIGDVNTSVDVRGVENANTR